MKGGVEWVEWGEMIEVLELNMVVDLEWK